MLPKTQKPDDFRHSHADILSERRAIWQQLSPRFATLNTSFPVGEQMGGPFYSILLPIVFSLPQRSQSSHLHGAPLHLPARRVINQGESLWQKRAPLALHICTRPRMNGGGGYYGRAGDIRLHDGSRGVWGELSVSASFWIQEVLQSL